MNLDRSEYEASSMIYAVLKVYNVFVGINNPKPIYSKHSLDLANVP
jgi:hypothetical protein